MHLTRRFETIASLLALSVLVVGCSQETKIGAVISETGAVSPYGRQVKRGIDLALEEINAAGGFKGKPIRLVYRDDATNAATGEQVVNELIDDEGVKVIIGAVSSPVTMAIAPICEKEGVLLLSPSSSAPAISDLGEYIFRNYPSDILEGTAMANFAKGQEIRRVVIFALDNAFGNGLAEVFTRQFESKTRKILKTFRIDMGGKSDLQAMVAEAGELNPEGVYIVAYDKTTIGLLKLLRQAGIKALMMGTASVTEQVPRLAGDAANHLVYAQPSFDPESAAKEVSEFVTAYRAMYRETPDIYAAHGYDAMKLIARAMDDTGFAYPDEVRRGLLTLKNYTGAAGRTDFDERGDVVRYPTVFVIQDGRPVAFEAFEKQGGELFPES